MASPVSDIALQGLEFWHSVAEKEYRNLESGDSIFEDMVPSSRYENNVLHKVRQKAL
jgi:hypothetical protein